mmetsp:Transcript_18337/g.57827  ORF Transcript_18337/g.57827 Transcript_18337/m.57827 type:complete len:278 (-) Transcript_18337:34-867(-)
MLCHSSLRRQLRVCTGHLARQRPEVVDPHGDHAPGQPHHDTCIHNGAPRVGEALDGSDDAEDCERDGPADDRALLGCVEKSHAVKGGEDAAEGCEAATLGAESEGTRDDEGRKLELERLVALDVSHTQCCARVRAPLHGGEPPQLEGLKGDGHEAPEGVGEDAHHANDAPMRGHTRGHGRIRRCLYACGTLCAHSGAYLVAKAHKQRRAARCGVHVERGGGGERRCESDHEGHGTRARHGTSGGGAAGVRREGGFGVDDTRAWAIESPGHLFAAVPR